MDAEELKDHLEPLYEAAMQEQKDIRDCIDHLTRSAKDFIAQRYSEEIHNLSAEGYRKLEDVIYRHTDKLALEISNIIYRYEE
ncbi:MAG: hypothetical protein HYZ44_06255 [Bacteroidetes bacterium]|nr:hypothetical protein [Bacteroidota bacterium]